MLLKVLTDYIDDALIVLQKNDTVKFYFVAKHLIYLEQVGHELRPPKSKYVRNGIFELRPKNIRILYCFHNGEAHCLVMYEKKRMSLPEKVIQLAEKRMNELKKNE